MAESKTRSTRNVWCETCKYYSLKTRTCDYYIFRHEQRNSGFGKDCTKRIRKKFASQED